MLHVYNVNSGVSITPHWGFSYWPIILLEQNWQHSLVEKYVDHIGYITCLNLHGHAFTTFDWTRLLENTPWSQSQPSFNLVMKWKLGKEETLRFYFVIRIIRHEQQGEYGWNNWYGVTSLSPSAFVNHFQGKTRM